MSLGPWVCRLRRHPVTVEKTSSILVGTASPVYGSKVERLLYKRTVVSSILAAGTMPSSGFGTGPRLLSEELRVRLSPRALRAAGT